VEQKFDTGRSYDGPYSLEFRPNKAGFGICR